MNSKTAYTLYPSPLGDILLARSEAGLTHIVFQEGTHPLTPESDWLYDSAAFEDATAQLKAYFAGDLQAFDLPLAPEGTAFQQTVWEALKSIPYGETISYGELAQEIGRPNAPRAVGAANGRNPLPIVIPCHRVIGQDGSLTGYGGGLHIKKALLSLEKNGRLEVEEQLPLL
ncbi:MAG: methylated-DNA--[protein]-cysteine S-methyltransferase [Candidatus Promineifilaceae bacterium]